MTMPGTQCPRSQGRPAVARREATTFREKGHFRTKVYLVGGGARVCLAHQALLALPLQLPYQSRIPIFLIPCSESCSRLNS